MAKYGKHFSTVATPQKEAIPGETMVANEGGGFSFPVDDWTRLDRFVVLGTIGGTYYTGESKLTKENGEAVLRCIKADGLRTVKRIVELSVGGRAPKPDPAIFALAMAAKLGNDETRKLALASVNDVCRIGTHLLLFAESVKAFGGWGQGTMNAVGGWFQRDPNTVAYQAVKYRQREGWALADLLRKAHPKPKDDTQNRLFKWIVDRQLPEAGSLPLIQQEPLRLLYAFEEAQKATEPKVWVELIRKYNLPREALPTEALNSKEVWEALLEKMPMTAMIRSLAKLTNLGIVAPFAAGTQHVVAELVNAERIQKSRIHPWSVIVALQTYKQGHGARAQRRENALTWTPVPQVLDALDQAFQLSFGNVQPTGKRILMGIDVSGSMSSHMSPDVMGVPGFKANQAAAAMAFIHARTEPNLLTMAFDTAPHPTDISKAKRIDDVIASVSKWTGGTDCAVPLLWATQQKLNVDAFLLYTDEQTWAGSVHPIQAVQNYRKAFNLPAKLVSAAMTPTGHSINRQEPEDGGSLSVVGFDSAAPTIIEDFLR